MIDFLFKAISRYLTGRKSLCLVCDKADTNSSLLPEFYRDNASDYGCSYFGKIVVERLGLRRSSIHYEVSK
jgi:hypothetical protein